ncbi:hypothetical protein PQR75_00760 [Paraburkholderia fungorum]|uniref:hypothetical protein n=1 Tax=Paraburkholderia fungorum TaxID=134537 RepID=UPI0038BB0EB9
MQVSLHQLKRVVLAQSGVKVRQVEAFGLKHVLGVARYVGRILHRARVFEGLQFVRERGTFRLQFSD